MNSAVEARLAALPGATPVERRADGYWMAAPELDVTALAAMMREVGARLSTMTGEAAADGETAVLYHYVVEREAFNFETRTRGNSLPSITPLTAQADWIEREIHDLYAVEFVGHPNLERLVRPAQLPAGFFRKGQA